MGKKNDCQKSICLLGRIRLATVAAASALKATLPSRSRMADKFKDATFRS
jgi:hypothetical protein